MSSHIVEVCKIDGVEKHPNADRLDIVTIKGWQCVTGNGDYRKDDICIYIPIDSVLPDKLVKFLFGPDSKIQIKNGRIKTIKLRGAISQGMAVRPEVVGLDPNLLHVGLDVAKTLGITKYEPPETKAPNVRGNQVSKKQVNPFFHKYTDIENFKNYNDVFTEGETVAVTEKIHGTNFRAGWVKSVANTWFKRVRKFFGQLPEYEFAFGSRNMQLQDRHGQSTYYATNVYAEAVDKYNLRTALKPGQVIYGEIYGDGIQKGYVYGCKAGERRLAIFDLMEGDRYVNHEQLKHFFTVTGLPNVPLLYIGPFSQSHIKDLAKGASVLAPSQKVREGVVVKPYQEATCQMGRKVLKFINDDYLMKDNTEFH